MCVCVNLKVDDGCDVLGLEDGDGPVHGLAQQGIGTLGLSTANTRSETSTPAHGSSAWWPPHKQTQTRAPTQNSHRPEKNTKYSGTDLAHELVDVDGPAQQLHKTLLEQQVPAGRWHLKTVRLP